MSLLTRKLIKGNQGGQSKTFNASVIISFCWHICLFSIVSITFPPLKINYPGGEVAFLGSILDRHDLGDSRQDLSHKQGGSKYFKIAEENVFKQDLGDYTKLASFLGKPRNYFPVSAAEYRFWQRSNLDRGRDSFLMQLLREKIVSSTNNPEVNIFDVKDLPDLHIYFKEGLLRPLKFNLLISKRGRVRFLNKVISSGSIEVDMIVQRAISRLVFDPSRVGVKHWRTLNLDFKNDSN